MLLCFFKVKKGLLRWYKLYLKVALNLQVSYHRITVSLPHLPLKTHIQKSTDNCTVCTVHLLGTYGLLTLTNGIEQARIHLWKTLSLWTCIIPSPLKNTNKQTTEHLMFFQGKCREGINWNSFVFKIICEASKLCLLESVFQLWSLELFAFLITFLIPVSKYLVLCIYRVRELIHQGLLILPQPLKSFPQENMSNLKVQRTSFFAGFDKWQFLKICWIWKKNRNYTPWTV